MCWLWKAHRWRSEVLCRRKVWCQEMCSNHRTPYSMLLWMDALRGQVNVDHYPYVLSGASGWPLCNKAPSQSPQFLLFLILVNGCIVFQQNIFLHKQDTWLLHTPAKIYGYLWAQTSFQSYKIFIFFQCYYFFIEDRGSTEAFFLLLNSCSAHRKFAINDGMYNLSFLVLSIIWDGINLLFTHLNMKRTVS